VIKRIILLGLFSTLLITASINPVVASDLAPSVAILDSSVDGNIVEIKKNLLHEVCILEWSVCPNGRYFLEGPALPFCQLNMAYLAPLIMGHKWLQSPSRRIQVSLLYL
jgi:hypothetical protein